MREDMPCVADLFQAGFSVCLDRRLARLPRNFPSLTAPILFLRRMWTKLGGQQLLSESMDWLRVLSPARFALSRLEKRISLVKVARPICMAIDRVATPNRFQLKAKVAAHTIDVDLNDHFLIDYVRDFAAQYSLRPIWDTDFVRWRLKTRCAKSTSREACVPCRIREGHASVGLLLVLLSTARRSPRPSIK